MKHMATTLLALVAALSLGAAIRPEHMPKPNRLHLYTVWGRSNAIAKDRTTDSEANRNRLFVFDAKNEWNVSKEGVSLGMNMVSSGPIHHVGLVPCADASLAFESWRPSGSSYVQAIARTRAAMKASCLTGLVWLPGDAGDDDATQLLATLRQARKDLDFGDFCIVVGVRDASVGAALKGKLPNLHVVTLTGNWPTDADNLAMALKNFVDATVTSWVSPVKAYVNGVAVKVQGARNSAYPMNQEWPGYQRPLEQTRVDGFVSFDVAEKPVELALEMPRGVPNDVRIRPLGVKHETRVEGNRLYVTVTKPEQFVVELGVKGLQMHVFANPPFKYQHVPNELYFGPGEHDVGIIAPESGQTVCIDEGAVVYGCICCHKVKDVKIVGRGVLDASKLHRCDKKSKPYQWTLKRGLDSDSLARSSGCFMAYASQNVSVEGIVLRDSGRWTMLVRFGSSGISFDNIKIVGQWRYCTDGLDVWGSGNVSVRNSFMRTFDDCIVLRGDPNYPVRNLFVENCVLWCDWGKNLEIITDGGVCDIENVLYRDVKIAEASGTACAISVCGALGGTFKNIRYENIEVDFPNPRYEYYFQKRVGEAFPFKPKTSASVVSVGGNRRLDAKGQLVRPPVAGQKMTVRNVRFDGVRVYGDAPRPVATVVEQTDYHDYADITFTNMDKKVYFWKKLWKDRTDAEKMNATAMNRMSQAAYEEGGKGGKYKVLIYGNSILLHRPLPTIGWTNCWGMAASSREKDFAHLLLKDMAAKKGSKPDYRMRGLYWFETDFANFKIKEELGMDIAYKPDYVVIAIGENVKNLKSEAEQKLYRQRLVELAEAFKANGNAPRIVFRSPFWENPLKARLTREAAEQTGSLYVDAGYIGKDKSNLAIGLFAHTGVANHPGDKGMRALADLILPVLLGE